MHNKILLFLITIVLNSVYENCLYAERLSFIQLSESDWRIPTPLTIYKEGGKFLWIGTKDGVYQFNGYNFRHYNKNNTPNSLNGEFTNKIQMDAMGNLWILTNKGIGLYNKEKDCFLKVSQDKEINGPYFSSCLVKNGVVFGGQNKISFYSYETKEITLLKTFEKLKTNLNFNYIFSLDNDKIIVDGEKYILKVDLKKDTISKINCSSVVSCMFVDQQKRIWVGCYDKSLSCYNIDGVKLNEYTHTNSSLSNELILSIEQQDSLLWIGTDGGGINIVNTHTNQIKRIKHIRGNYQSLPSNSINSLHVDANNTIWAGTVRDGIIAIRKNSITSYVEVSEGNKYGLSNPTILSLFQDENEDFIWIGTDGEGINQLSLKDRTFKHYPLTQGLKVISIAQYNKHTLLLSIYTKGLFFFDKDKGTLHPMNINKEQLKSVYCLSKTDINLYNLSPNTILALTDKIYKYQIHTGDIIELQFENHKGTHAILPIGKYKGMFYCYNEAAIFCFNENGSVIQTLFEPNSNNRIKSATIDPSGNIWMVTSQGIQYLSYKGKNIHCINNNLIKNASSIIADKDGKIWMGDGDKLYAYADTTNSLSTFGTTDGVIPNEYIEKSCYVTEQGDILLGGNKGLTIIDADIKFNTKEVSSIVLMKMKIDNKEWNEYDLNNLDTYEVTAGSKSLEIQIAAIEEDILRPKLYKYEIKGDNEQTIQSYSPILKLNTFSPGESNIYVSCSTRSGKWTEPCKIITLVFLLPWYESNWFYGICILLFTIIVISISVVIIRRKETKMKLALKEKEKSMYKEKVEFLININHELRTPLTLISEPLKRLLEITSESSLSYDILKKINHQTERMKKILNMVLDLRKIEVGKESIHIQKNVVNQWLTEIVSDFTFTEDFSDFTIKTKLDSSIDTVNFDKEKCEIVLTNLLMNAIKHSNSNDTILVKSEITADQMLTISVSDQGEGLRDTEIDKLFIRFYQGNNEKNGNGIGLSYAKLLVDLHKGQIGAFNNDTKGATFYFKIPLNLKIGNIPCKTKHYLNDLLYPEHKYRITNQAIYALNNKTLNKSILIVDDNIELIQFLKESFSTKFKEIYTARNGKEAFELILNNNIDIVVSDVMMPIMDGYELCMKIRKTLECSHIPIILLTAMNEESSKRLGYKTGADAYIPKPFEVETLYEIIKSKFQIREEIRNKYMQFSVIPEPKEDTFSLVDETFLINLNKIITEHINDSKLDIPFVCKEIGMSRTSLYNKIKALTDMSCNEYINKIRLERAVSLVKTTQKNFMEIADETGFNNSRYFSTIFKQYTGMTPSQYRKEFRNNKNKFINK